MGASLVNPKDIYDVAKISKIISGSFGELAENLWIEARDIGQISCGCEDHIKCLQWGRIEISNAF